MRFQGLRGYVISIFVSIIYTIVGEVSRNDTGINGTQGNIVKHKIPVRACLRISRWVSVKRRNSIANAL